MAKREPRTLYWHVQDESGKSVIGETQNLVCSPDMYLSILTRKFTREGMNIKNIAVSVKNDVQVI